MPYTVRKRKCKKSDGGSGSYVLSYTDKKGKKHSACHTSRKKARGQIAAIEAEGVEMNDSLSELRELIREYSIEEVKKSKEKKEKKSDVEDMDGDGDVDAADYKTKVYMAGGVPKDKAIKMSRKFDNK
jgi:hypothetical protein